MKRIRSRLTGIQTSAFSLCLMLLFGGTLIVLDLSWGASAAPPSSPSLDIVALIDNSEGMNQMGRDVGGMRWQAARLLIDRLHSGDSVSIIAFSDRPTLLVPPTQLTGDLDQKDELKWKLDVNRPGGGPKNIGAALSAASDVLTKVSRKTSKKAVILLTEGEEVNRFTSDPRLEFYTVALSATRRQDQASSPFEFYSHTSSDFVNIFSQIINRLQGYSSFISRTVRIDEAKTQSLLLHDPRSREAEFQFTFEKGKGTVVTLADPSGHHIYPYTQKEETYQLYRIPPKPHPPYLPLGIWQARIRSQQTSEVKMTLAVKNQSNVPITKLRFKRLEKSYPLNEAISFKIEAVENADGLRLPYLDVHVVSRTGEHLLKAARLDRKPIYQGQYQNTAFEGAYTFFIQSNQAYVVLDYPLQTVEVLASNEPQFPLFATLAILVSGGVALGGLLWYFLRFGREDKTDTSNVLDFGQNERVLGQKTRERENAKTGQRKELDTVSFSTMADWINNSVL